MLEGSQRDSAKQTTDSNAPNSEFEEILDLPDAGLFAALEDLYNYQDQQQLHNELENDSEWVEESMKIQEMERDFLALPADIDGSIAYHKLYPRLLEAHFNARRAMERPESSVVLEMKRGYVNEQVKRLTSTEEARNIQERLSYDYYLEQFMGSYCNIVESVQAELQGFYKSLESTCYNFEQELLKLCADWSADNQPRKKQKGMLTVQQKRAMQSNLKVNFGDAIRGLKKDFQRRKKISKLPSSAINQLKYWWEKHFHWPYPSEDEKKQFCDQTGLSKVQVNNWFINQRKRHWHKLFPSGIPQNAEEATQILHERGILSLSNLNTLQIT